MVAHPDRLTPGRRLTSLYLLVQGISGAVWWFSLFTSPAFRKEFRPDGYPADFISTFILADLILFVGASLVTSLLVATNHRWWPPALWVCAGAVCYAWLYTLGIAMMSSGFMNAALMMTAPAVCMVAITITMKPGAPVYPQLRFHVARTDAPHIRWTLVQTMFFGFSSLPSSRR